MGALSLVQAARAAAFNVASREVGGYLWKSQLALSQLPFFL